MPQISDIITAEDFEAGWDHPVVKMKGVRGVAVVARDATVATIEFPNGDVFTGSAKRAKGDTADSDVGLNLAYGRALIKAGLFYEALGHEQSNDLCTTNNTGEKSCQC